MSEEWRRAKASDIRPGDRVRTADGSEIVATHVEHPFMGRQSLVALIEDTPERWFKRPLPVDADVEVLTAGGAAE